jgi:hypothetical protein
MAQNHAGDMIGEIALAVGNEADAEMTSERPSIPHPYTGSIGMAAEVAKYGSCTDLPPVRK